MEKHGHFQGCLGDENCRCEIKRYWIIAGIVTITFAVEMMGSWLSNSIALYSDTLHIGTDLVGDVLAPIIESWIINKDDLAKKRIRARGGVISSLLLFLAIIPITIEAVERMFSPEPLHSTTMIIFAVVGLVGNLFAKQVHRHSRATHDTHFLLGAHIHTDILLSGGVILGGLAVLLTKLYIIDTLISGVIIPVLIWIAGKAMYRSIRSMLR